MGKPFIKLLHTINAGYFYDVNRNEVIRVDDELYHALLDSTFFEKDIQYKIDQLKEYGYLSDHHGSKVCHPLTNHVERKLSRCMQAITLQVTQQCNFRCKYCLYSEGNNHTQRSHSSKVMTWDVAKKAIDLLRVSSIESPKITIGFYGGEPLLQFSLIRRVVEYADNIFLGKDIQYMITTNSTLMNDEILSFMQEHRFQILISLDGIREIHNKNRVFANSGNGTYDTVIEKLRYVYQNYPELCKHMSINSVIDPTNSFEDINQLYQELSDMPSIKIMTNMLDDSSFKEKVKYSESFTVFSEYSLFLNYLAQMRRLKQTEVLSIHSNSVSHVSESINKMESVMNNSDIIAPSGPCVPGQSRLFVTVDGVLLPCERVSELSPATRLGDVVQGIDFEQAEHLLNVGALTSEQCLNCWAYSFCTACVRMAEDGEKLSARVKLRHCNAIQRSAERKLREMILLKENMMYYVKESYQRGEL